MRVDEQGPLAELAGNGSEFLQLSGSENNPRRGSKLEIHADSRTGNMVVCPVELQMTGRKKAQKLQKKKRI